MAEERSRPQYGEYATPEDQARASGVIDLPQAPSPQPTAPGPVPASSVAARPAPGQSVPSATASVPARKPRRWDTALSLLLLGYGLLAVVFGAAQYADLSLLVRDVFEMQGIGAFTSDARADAFGAAINVVNVVLYIVVFALTLGLLRARRIAFYVPLAGGILAGAVTLTLLAVVMIADPAFQDYLRSRSGP